MAYMERLGIDLGRFGKPTRSPGASSAGKELASSCNAVGGLFDTHRGMGEEMETTPKPTP